MATLVKIQLPATQTGLTLKAQLYNASTDETIGSEITAGFREIGSGIYTLLITLADDDQYAIRFFEDGDDIDVDPPLTATVINPAISVEQIADEVQTRTISRVTLVDVCSANTDMRGTDGANTTAPDNAGIAAIEAELPNLIHVGTSYKYTQTASDESGKTADVTITEVV